MKKIYLFILLFCSATAFTQKGSIKGIVNQYNNEPLDYASAILYALKDSNIVKAEFTDQEGKFAIYGMSNGEYFLRINFLGLEDFYSESFLYTNDEDFNFDMIVMEEPQNTLEEVTVSAKRPLLEMKPDKMVFNVDGSINATGSDGLELLRKSPGVVVDNNDNISLMGKSGVKVYIDGRPSPLNAEDLANYLKTLQAHEIDAIEIITNPSARYEAEGNAGIINIRLKKNENIGANGSISGGFQQGIKSRFNGSFQGNYRQNHTNLYGSYGYYDGATTNDFFLYREQFGLRFDQSNLGGGSWKGHNYRVGMDYFIGDEHTIGVLLNGNVGSGDWGLNTQTVMGSVGASVVDSLLSATSSSMYDRYNHNMNLNYRYVNDQGSTFNIDVDAGLYDNQSEESLPNIYTNEDGSVILRSIENFTESPTRIHIYTVKVDFETNGLGGKFGIGGKYSLVETDNSFNFYDVAESIRLLIPEQTNDFEYRENVNAFYTSYSRQWNKWNLVLGLRLEHTHSKGDLMAMIPTDNENVERDYVDFFPSGGVTYTPNQKNNFQLNFSRRLKRPNYKDLNPFRSKLDELTFELGNPFLRPEYATNVQLSHNYNYRFTTTVGFSHTKDGITRFTDVEGQKSSYITWLNLSDQYNYNLNFSAPVPITSFWNSYTSITGNIQKNKADYGNGRIVDLKNSTLNIYSQQTFTLPSDWSLEFSGWYQSPSLWGGTFEMNAMYNVDFGIQKKFLDGRGSIKASISDIFRTTDFYGESTFGELFMIAQGTNDSRRFRVNVTYNFGNQKVKSRKRKTGLEEEQNRISDGE